VVDQCRQEHGLAGVEAAHGPRCEEDADVAAGADQVPPGARRRDYDGAIRGVDVDAIARSPGQRGQ
jgi:hypothetical protein